MRRYRTKGLDPTAHAIVDFLAGRGLDGLTVLEVGGGVGAIQLELLRGGAARATSVELSAGYEEAARALAREARLEDRIDRRVLDLAEAAEEVGPADLVVLHRVVCCYPGFERLLGAAAERARSALVFSFPPRNALSLAFIRLVNLVFRLTRRELRVFAHPPEAMLAVLAGRGLRPAFRHRGRFWRVAAVERAG